MQPKIILPFWSINTHPERKYSVSLYWFLKESGKEYKLNLISVIFIAIIFEAVFWVEVLDSIVKIGNSSIIIYKTESRSLMREMGEHIEQGYHLCTETTVASER